LVHPLAAAPYQKGVNTCNNCGRRHEQQQSRPQLSAGGLSGKVKEQLKNGQRDPCNADDEYACAELPNNRLRTSLNRIHAIHQLILSEASNFARRFQKLTA
jgi:hypothetical protein